MVAIYARQSVEKIDSISIDTQIEDCKRKLKKGETYRVFSDSGYSGKNTQRPGLQEMMQLVEKGDVSKILVYKFDRISRSLIDFIVMTDEFDRHGTAFVSCNEEFDTSTPIGSTLMKMLAVFAQFERETIQQRVKDAYHSRSQKGFYMGGRVPYGYRAVRTVIGGIHTSKFVADSEEAKVVELIYSMYADDKTSLGDITRKLVSLGITKGEKSWSRARVADILKNPVYVKADADVWEFYTERGATVINDSAEFVGTNGCYYYSGDEAKDRKQSTIAGNIIVLAPHAGIIPSSLWLKCRTKLLSNSQVQAKPKAKNTWLAGKIKCGKCGYALTDKGYKNRNPRYLICSNRMNSNACEGAGTLHTDEVEAQVFLAIKRRLDEFDALNGEKREKANPEIAALNIELVKLRKEFDGYVKRIPEAEDLLFNAIKKKTAEIETRCSEINTRLAELKTIDKSNLNEIRNHVELWDTLQFDGRRKVVDVMIKRISATSEGINIEWRF